MNKKIKVDEFLTLLKIKSGFNNFSEDFQKLVKKDDKYNVIYLLEKMISKGKIKDNFFDKKIERLVRKFYQKYMYQLELINKYSNITDFLNHNYDWQGNISEGYFDTSFFLDYIQNNDDINSILSKLTLLGIDELEFNAQEDFKEREFEANINFEDNAVFEYTENIIPISLDAFNKVKYKTKSTNYILVVKPNRKSFESKIIVNNLNFDSKQLPDSLSKEILFKEIDEFIKENEIKLKDARNDINKIEIVDENIDILDKTLGNIENVLNDIDLYNKEDILNILSNMKIEINTLRLDSFVAKEGKRLIKKL